MTWIGGIFNKVDMGKGALKKELALMMKSAGPAGESPAVGHLHCINSLLDDTNGKALAKVSLPVEGISPEYLYTDYQERLALIYDGYLHYSENTEPELSQAQDRVDEMDADSLVQLLAEFPGELEQKVRRALTDLDGDYALAVSDIDRMVISRNQLGTRPLYFGEDDRFSAFASNRKPLWRIGLDNVMPLRAGKLAVFDSDGIRIKEATPVDKGEIDITNMARAVDDYEQALSSAVRKRLDRVRHMDKVGVLLSGGVDSCLIAKLVRDVASQYGIKVIGYTTGFPDSPDTSFAQEFAQELGIEHRVRVISIGEVEGFVPKVIEAVEDGDLVQVEAGICIYAALDMVTQDGVCVIFSGQGPDELWGGYDWYPEVLCQDGRQELCRRMWDDFNRADIETLDRENKIAMAHGIEIFFPYLDAEIVNVAMAVASELKVTSEDDHLGKHPHRQLAIRMGIPDKYANRSKDAAQHGSGIHNVLSEIAKKRGFDPALVKAIDYENEDITTAKLGSSSRYGYRYGEKKLWQVPQHVQFFLHTLAYRKGLLNKSVRDRVGYFLGEAKRSSPISMCDT